MWVELFDLLKKSPPLTLGSIGAITNVRDMKPSKFLYVVAGTPEIFQS